METRTLRYFLTIAREENMTNAAALLHVSQSALSRQMSDLEEKLGKKLFLRTGRKMILTEDGMHLRQRAEEILSLIEKTEAELKSQGDIISGDIYIGAGETRSFQLVAKAIDNTQKQYPDIKFHIYSGNATDVLQRLEHGTLDFGLLFEDVSPEHYNILPFPVPDIGGILVRKDDPLASRTTVTLDDMFTMPLIISTRAGKDSVLENISPKDRERLDIRGTYNLIYNASLMVEQGLANAIAIDHLVHASGDSPLRFLPFDPPHYMKTIFVWKKQKLLTKAQQIFLDEFTRILRKYH